MTTPTPAPPSLAEMRETLETIGKTLMAPDTAYAVAAANFALDRLSQTEANATAWHGAVDTICTVLGIEGALGASEAIEAVRDHDGALRGRVRQAEAERDRARRDAAQNNEDANLQARGWNAASDRARAAEASNAALSERVKALEVFATHVQSCAPLTSDPDTVAEEEVEITLTWGDIWRVRRTLLSQKDPI